MDSLGVGQEVTDDKRRKSGGRVQPRKRPDDEAANSSEEVRLERRSIAIQATHHGAASTTYPTIFDPMLLEASSSPKSPFPPGIGEPRLNSHSNILNFTTMDALGLGLPFPPHLYGAASSPDFGIPNFNPSVALAGQLSELLPYSCGDAAAAIRRSALFPYTGTCFPVTNALIMNGISPSLRCEQQDLSTPGVSQREAFMARGLTTGSLSRQLPSAFPSLQLASKIPWSFGLPSSFPHLPRTSLASTGSTTAELVGVSFQDNDGTHYVGRHESFPKVLHSALTELESVAGGTDIAAFLPHGRSFQITDQTRFEEKVLPCFFPRMKGFASFQRQLNLYKFRRRGGAGLNRNSYSHELFVRHQPELTRHMRRTRVKQCTHSRVSKDSTKSQSHAEEESSTTF